MRNRMAVRVMVLGLFMQLPVTWTSFDGMVHVDVRFFGPLAGFLLREGHTYWQDATVSLKFIGI